MMWIFESVINCTNNARYWNDHGR